jgi:hypothetical protein
MDFRAQLETWIDKNSKTVDLNGGDLGKSVFVEGAELKPIRKQLRRIGYQLYIVAGQKTFPMHTSSGLVMREAEYWIKRLSLSDFSALAIGLDYYSGFARRKRVRFKSSN